MDELSDDQRRCLRLIYDHFHARATWPQLASIRHQLYAADDEFPFVEVLDTIPTDLQNSMRPDGEVWLTARGIRACAGGDAPELTDFMTFLDICRERYRADPDAQVGSADLLAAGFTPDRIRKVYLITQREHEPWRGGGGLADGSWHWLVSHDIAAFRGATAIDAYLAKKDEFRSARVRKPALAPAPQPPAPAPLDPATLRALADLICGESGPAYRSGPGLTQFFRAAGVAGVVHDGSSRRPWTLHQLELLNAHPAQIQRVITRLTDPREYNGDPVTTRAAIEQLNRALAIEGLHVTLDGTKPHLERRAAELAPPAPTAGPLAMPTVDFMSVVTDNALAAVLAARWDEVARCLAANAPLAAVVLLGSIIEGALLATARHDPAAAGRSARAPKDKRGAVTRIEDWSLAQLLEVAADLNWIHAASNQFAVVLRDYRNLIHPGKQVKQRVAVDTGTAEICVRVVVKALDDLAARQAHP